jgi:hypothetical protein
MPGGGARRRTGRIDSTLIRLFLGVEGTKDLCGFLRITPGAREAGQFNRPGKAMTPAYAFKTAELSW